MRRHVRDDQGASAVEYGLIVVAIAAVIVAIVFSLGTVTASMFSDGCDNLKDEVNKSQGGSGASC